MNRKQADMIFHAMYQRPEIRSLFDFWCAGRDGKDATWPAFLREVADSLTPPMTNAEAFLALCRKA